MGMVITQNPVLMAGDEAELSADHPIIGWRNIVTPTNVALTSGSSAMNYPPSNLANPATHLFWRALVWNQSTYITVTTGTADPIDYLAIARHNLGSTGAQVNVGYLSVADSPATLQNLTDPVILPDDGPALFRFPAQSLSNVTFIIGYGAVAVPVQIAVMYVGKLLVLPRKIYQGLAPINYARVAKVTNGRSEAGNFLGRIVLQEFVKNNIPLSLINPTYFRDHIAEFLVDSKENPFFFAWRPEMYPQEIGYCHMTNDPLPVNQSPHGLIQMQMEMTGVI
jgi:hypothetical protein